MASLRVLAFDHEGRPVQFDTWLDDLQLYLLSDSNDSVSLFDLASGAATAPPATADSANRSEWLTHDAAPNLAIHNQLPLAECAHLGQHRTAQALYDAVVTRYSSPATAVLGRLLLPYLFPELSAFSTVEDLVSHLRTSDALYQATVPAEFLERNQPLMFITLYFIVTRLPDSLRSVRDHFLSLDPTSLTIDLLEQHLLAPKTSALAVGAARGTPRPSFFEGCSPSPLAPSYASAAAANVSDAEEVGAASTNAKRRSSKGKGGRGGGGGTGGGGGGSGSGGGGSSGGSGGSGGGGSGGTGGGSGGSGGGGGGSGGSGGSGGAATAAASERKPVAPAAPHAESFTLSTVASPASMTLGVLSLVTTSSSLAVQIYLGIAAAALGASESGTLPGTAPAQALHTFTLDSGASRCFFRDNTTLTPLPAPVPVRLADPSRGSVVARSSTVLPCPAVPSGSLSSLHLPSFSTNLVSTAALHDAMVTTTTPGGSSLYTLATEPPQVAAPAQVSTSGQVATSCSCRLLTQQNLLWHHRLGHPSLPRLRGMHSRLLVSSLPRSLPPLLPSPALPCLPCVEGQQRAAPHSSSFPPTTAPLQTLHMDVKGEVVDVLIPWIRTIRLQLRERFGQDLPVLRLHSDREGEFSSKLLREFCHGEGILQSFTLSDSPQQNGIAERRIGLVMEPRVTLPETLPTLRWTGEVGDASVFRVTGFLGSLLKPLPLPLFPSPTPTLFLAPGPPPVDPLPPQGPAPSGVSQVDPLPGVAPVEIAVSGSGGAEPGGEEPGGAEPEGVEPRGAELEGAESGGAEPRGAALSGGPAGASPQLSPQQLLEWLVRRARLRSGAPGVGGAGDSGAGGAGVTAGAGGTGGTAAAGPGGARTRANGAGGSCAGGAGTGGAGARGAGVGGTGAGGAGGAGAGAVDPGAGGAGGTVRPRPYFSGGLTEPCEPASRPVSPVCIARCVPRSPPPPVPDTHAMALRPSSIPLRVPLHALPEVPDPESARARAASPTLSRLLATVVTDPSFESAAASALVADLLDFAAACRLDYATALIAVSASASPPSIGGECALGPDVLEDRQEYFECLAAAVPCFASMLLALEGNPDAPDIPTPRSYAEAITGTYVDEVPPPGTNIVGGMWIFRVNRPPGSPPAYKARYVAQGFYQRKGVDYFPTFSPTPKMTTLRVLLHVAAQRDYELHSLEFSAAFLQGSLHEEIWLRRPPGFTGTTLAALGFAPSTADPSLILCTDTSLPSFYVLVYVDDLVFATADTEALTLMNTSGMGLVLGGRGPVFLTGPADAAWVDDSATQRSSQGYTFSLGAMAAQELRWLTYVLTDLGEQPRSPPVLYIDNEAMIALCQEHRLEHRTKHIALRYFLARELQQRGQLRLAYVATRANTADIFTKALPPGDHQRFSTVLGLVPTLPHLLTA
ncbi:unnamed protein product [Closterium sp. NIES-53]